MPWGLSADPRRSAARCSALCGWMSTDWEWSSITADGSGRAWTDRSSRGSVRQRSGASACAGPRETVHWKQFMLAGLASKIHSNACSTAESSNRSILANQRYPITHRIMDQETHWTAFLGSLVRKPGLRVACFCGLAGPGRLNDSGDIATVCRCVRTHRSTNSAVLLKAGLGAPGSATTQRALSRDTLRIKRPSGLSAGKIAAAVNSRFWCQQSSSSFVCSMRQTYAGRRLSGGRDQVASAPGWQHQQQHRQIRSSATAWH